MEPCYFWSTCGTNTIYLDRVAPQLLGAQHAAGGSERNWSLQGRINGRDRGRQSTAVLARMTRLAWNQNLVDRRRQRAARRTAAIQRVNARNGARAVPARPAPKPYPLQDNEVWESCDESSRAATMPIASTGRRSLCLRCADVRSSDRRFADRQMRPACTDESGERGAPGARDACIAGRRSADSP